MGPAAHRGFRPSGSMNFPMLDVHSPTLTSVSLVASLGCKHCPPTTTSSVEKLNPKCAFPNARALGDALATAITVTTIHIQLRIDVSTLALWQKRSTPSTRPHFPPRPRRRLTLRCLPHSRRRARRSSWAVPAARATPRFYINAGYPTWTSVTWPAVVSCCEAGHAPACPRRITGRYANLHAGTSLHHFGTCAPPPALAAPLAQHLHHQRAGAPGQPRSCPGAPPRCPFMPSLRLASSTPTLLGPPCSPWVTRRTCPISQPRAPFSGTRFAISL